MRDQFAAREKIKYVEAHCAKGRYQINKEVFAAAKVANRKIRNHRLTVSFINRYTSHII
jgi:hypothetical protein